MYENFAFYENICAQTKGKRRASALRVLSKHANRMRGTGFGCFGISFLCGMCCMDCTRTCMTHGERGSNWLKALNVYKGVQPDKVQSIFEGVIEKMKLIRERYKHVLEDGQHSVMHSNINGHDIVISQRINDVRTRIAISGDQWFATLITDVYKKFVIGKDIEYITLTSDEVLNLLLALPFFYPVIQHTMRNFTPPMDEYVIARISTLLQSNKR